MAARKALDVDRQNHLVREGRRREWQGEDAVEVDIEQNGFTRLAGESQRADAAAGVDVERLLHLGGLVGQRRLDALREV